MHLDALRHQASCQSFFKSLLHVQESRQLYEQENGPRVAEDENTTALQTLACHVVVHLCPSGAWFLCTILVWVSLAAHALPAQQPDKSVCSCGISVCNCSHPVCSCGHSLCGCYHLVCSCVNIALRIQYFKYMFHPILTKSGVLNSAYLCKLQHKQIAVISTATRPELTCVCAHC